MQMQPYSQPSVTLTTHSRLRHISDNIGTFFLHYWNVIISAFFGIICLAALGTPILTYVDLGSIGRPIFALLGRFCGQIPSHSFYIGGHQCGLCVHCLAIYGSIFVGSVIFALNKKHMRGIPWWFLVLLALPLAYDGFSQMFGLRESTWEIRLITGALFGLGFVWFALPFVQKMLLETTPSLNP